MLNTLWTIHTVFVFSNSQFVFILHKKLLSKTILLFILTILYNVHKLYLSNKNNFE